MVRSCPVHPVYQGCTRTPFADQFERDFVSHVQQQLLALGGPGQHYVFSCLFLNLWTQHAKIFLDIDDALSDDAMDSFTSHPFILPQPEIGNLEDIEHAMRGVVSTQQGRDALAKFVINEDYIQKLIPFVEMAEDLESLKDLHLLCNIMKMLILLNDSQIIDHIVDENVVFGVVGALECKCIGGKFLRNPRDHDPKMHSLY